jgi:hypothetical protein
MQTATNPETGEKVILIGDNWQKIEQSATNDKGAKAYLVGGQWITDDKSKEISLKGIAAEAGKGLLRGASDVGIMAAKATGSLLGGPIGGFLVGKGVDTLAAPSREMVKAAPENEAERFAGTAGELSGASIGGIGKPISNVAVPALLGAAGEQVAGEPGKLVGSLLPAVTTAAAGLLRTLSRGAQAPAAARLETMERVGVSPTLADIAPSRANVQAIAGRIPVSAEISNKAITRQAAQIESKVDDLISNVGTKERVGESVQAGLGEWKNQFYETWRKLDDKVSILMGQNTVPLTETKKALGILTTKIDNDELNAIFTPQTLEKIRTAIQGDKALPFDVVLQLRREVGKKASGGFAALKSDVDTGDLKMLYGALSGDIKNAAEAVPGATAAITKANKYYSIGSERIDSYYGRLYKQANPEKVFDALESGSQKGVVEVRNVMKAIPKDARDEVAGLVLSRLGATGGKREGTFSVDVFVTRWQQLPEGSKRALFGGTTNPSMMLDLDKIAQAAKVAKESGKALYNPSGTGMVIGYGGTAGALLVAPLETMGVMGGVSAATYLMTNPKFVKWLAQSTTLPTGAAPAHIARLAQIANSSDSEFKESVREYATALQGLK